MSTNACPRPPFLPGNEESFAAHVPNHLTEWYHYFREAYDYMERNETITAELKGQIDHLMLQNQAVQQEHENLKTELVGEQQNSTRLQGVVDYQKTQLREAQQQYMEAVMDKHKAINATMPTVSTPLPVPTPEPAAKSPAATPVGAPASITPPSTSSAHLSERLPDPDPFDGDRKDLRRFVTQIRGKMTVNQDRFPTPQSRMTYVTSRLKGAPYDQILPYLHGGTCQLPDYEEILNILERAFGDPNRARNARNTLFRLRQGNKEFSIFFAEFHRLALEGEMPEAALPTLLEQAINRELRSMLLHHQPPEGDYHQLATFLQNLETRRMQYDTASHTYVRATRSTYPTSPIQPARSQQGKFTPKTPNVSTTQLRQPTLGPHPEPMDLSTSRRASSLGLTRREKGECFRCGSKDHLVRNCPHPDNRPTQLASGNIQLLHDSPPRSPPRGRSPASDGSSEPEYSAKGVSLV